MSGEAEHTELRALLDAWQAAELPDPDTVPHAAELGDAIQRIWQLQERIRRYEISGRFDEDTVRIVRDIQAADRERLHHLRRFSAAVLRDHCVDLVSIDSGLDSYLDRTAVVRIAARHGKGTGEYETARREMWLSAGLPDIFRTEPFHRLLYVHERLWEIEGELREAFRGPLAAVSVDLCRSLHFVNDERARVKELLGQVHGSAFCDAKERVLYELPPRWDNKALCWRPEG